MSNKAPYIQVVLKDTRTDLSQYIDYFKFEQDMDKDNLLEFKMAHKDNKEMIDLIDTADLNTGKYLKFHFGYLGDQVSENKVARISNFKPKYAKLVNAIVQALDKGAELKKNKPKTIWEDKTSSQIAIEIARAYSMTFEVDPTTKIWDSLPQGDKSDFEFLQEMADKEPDNYVFYIQGDKLLFKKIGLEKIAKFLYSYGDPDLIHFLPSIEETKDKDGEASQVTAKGYDPRKKSSVSATSKNSQTKLGANSYHYDYDVNGNEKKVMDKPVFIPTDDKEELQNTADSKQKKANLNVITAELKVQGNPLLEVGELVTIKKVSKKFEGNWLISRVTQVILGGSTYTTICKLKKNGANKPLSKGNEEGRANKTVGRTNPEATKKIYNYDVDGNAK